MQVKISKGEPAMDESRPKSVPDDTVQAPPKGAPEPPTAAGNGAMRGNRDTGEAVPARPRGRPRSRARTLLLGVILAAVSGAVVYAVHYFSYAGVHPSTDDAYVQGDTTIISAKVFGRVSRVLVRGYERVQKGEMLVELDPVDAQIAVHQAEAALTSAKAQVAQAQAALIAQQAQTTAALAQAQAA